MSHPITVGECFDRYFAAYLDVEAASPERAVDAWKALRPAFGHLTPGAITPELVNAHVRARGVANSTIRRELGVLIACLHWAHQHGMVTALPAIKRPTAPPPNPKALGADDVRKLALAVAENPRLLAYVQISLLTGQRKTAVLTLTWDQIDWATKEVDFVNPAMPRATRRKGRGRLPMSARLHDVLRGLWEDRQGPFVIQASGRPVAHIYHAWGKACRAAGVTATPHALRHTVATNLISAGEPLTQVSKLLGHSSTRVTEAVYYRAHTSHLQAAADRLGTGI